MPTLTTMIHIKNSDKFEVRGEGAQLEQWKPYAVLGIQADSIETLFFAEIEQLETLKAAIDNAIKETNELQIKYDSRPGAFSYLPVPASNEDDYPF
jgi:hypothetical protein